jgi:hypothetical protein
MTRWLPDVHKLTSSSNAGAAPSSLAIDSSPSDVDTIVPVSLRHQSLCEDHAVIGGTTRLEQQRWFGPCVHLRCKLPGEYPHCGCNS